MTTLANLKGKQIGKVALKTIIGGGEGIDEFLVVDTSC